jgi:glycosyltransferase involved in cell wall biosynthesis
LPIKKNTARRAVCLSRLEPEKGLFELIEAWQTVDPAWQLTLYGDGSLHEALKERIRCLGLHERITISEPVPHNQVFAVFAQHNVFVLTSPCEGLGISYLEALYMKIPCVGLDVPGVRDTLAAARGILLPQDGWKQKLNQALIDAECLGNSPAWQRQIADYFANEVMPRINPGTSKWFDA